LIWYYFTLFLAVFKIKIEDRIRIMPRILAVVRDSPKIKMPIAAATSGSK